MPGIALKYHFNLPSLSLLPGIHFQDAESAREGEEMPPRIGLFEFEAYCRDIPGSLFFLF